MAFYKCEEAEGDRVILTCDCVSECTEIHFIKDNKYNEIHASIQPRGTSKSSLWNRLEIMWKILTQGKLHEDYITMNSETVIKLSEWLNKNI